MNFQNLRQYLLTLNVATLSILNNATVANSNTLNYTIHEILEDCYFMTHPIHYPAAKFLTKSRFQLEGLTVSLKVYLKAYQFAYDACNGISMLSMKDFSFSETIP